MQRAGTDHSQFIVNVLGCYPKLPNTELLDDTVALLIDFALRAKDDDVRRASQQLLRQCVMPHETIVHSLEHIFDTALPWYTLVDVLESLPDMSLLSQATVNQICEQYNHRDSQLRGACHALMRRSEKASLVYDWLDRNICVDTDDADLLLLLEAMPSAVCAPPSLQDKLVCLMEEGRGPAVQQKVPHVLYELF